MGCHKSPQQPFWAFTLCEQSLLQEESSLTYWPPHRSSPGTFLSFSTVTQRNWPAESTLLQQHLVKAPLFMAFFCRDLLSCRFIAICQRSHSVASPRKATQHHRSLSGRNPLTQSSEKQDLLQVRYTPSTSSFPSWTLLMKQLLSWASTEEFFF